MHDDNKKLVLHIAPTPFFADRGCHIRIEGIARSLTQLGYENLVCTYHHGREIKGIHTSRISTIKAYTQTEAGPNKYKLWADLKLLLLAVKEIYKQKPNVIHAHLHEGLMIGLIAKILFFWRRIPVIADMQGSLSGELDAHGSFNKRPWLKWPVTLIERTLMRLSKTIICSSSHSLSKFKTEFGLDSNKISLVQDGADLAAPLSPADITSLKNKLNLPENSVIATYSGALLDGKGLNELKELMLLSSNIESVHFLIIGYPTEDLELFITEHQLSHQCTLTGRVPFESLASLLGVADIAIDPKHGDSGEGSGKMLNYLASGLPVLAFDTQNNRDFLPQGSDLANSSKEMAALLASWVEDPSKLEHIRRANLQHFTKHHSWQQTVDQLDKVYSSLQLKG